MLKPNNYFGGGSRGPMPCECCKRPVKFDREHPAMYGSGRFCSEICAKLRSPEAHWNWMVENPEEMEKWQEWMKEQDGKIQVNQFGDNKPIQF